MKLLTLNTASLLGDDPGRNLANFCQVVAENDYDVIALQEVNQKKDAPNVAMSELDNYIPCQDRVPIKEGNFVYMVEKTLRESGQLWYWSWLPTHIGWDTYDEGVAVLTRHPIRKTNAVYISNSTDYNFPKTRMALGIQSVFNGRKEWFYSVHFDRWNDHEEPFDLQWNNFVERALDTAAPVFVMGDFNYDANQPGGSLEHALKTSNLFDTFERAEYHDDGITVADYIAGWSDKDHPKEMRIDFILSNTDDTVLASEVVFNGKRFPQVSDHFGVEAIVEERKNVYKDEPSKKIPEFSSQQQGTIPLTVIRRAGPLVVDIPFLRERILERVNNYSLLDLIEETLKHDDE